MMASRISRLKPTGGNIVRCSEKFCTASFEAALWRSCGSYSAKESKHLNGKCQFDVLTSDLYAFREAAVSTKSDSLYLETCREMAFSVT